MERPTSGVVDKTLSKYHLYDGFLKYNSRMVVTPNSSWRKRLFEEHHCTLIAGHGGVFKTYQMLKRSFYWIGMKKDIKQ